ncbi:MAG: hypothetical protein IT456_24625 [Planctomycetes bacterium]|nr:hypothetical protein [Planctomycetota bacterium]
MRSPFTVVFLLTGIVAAQQLPMPAFSGTYIAPLTRGFHFTAPVDFVITSLQVPDEANVGVQAVEVLLLPSTPPVFPGTTTGTQLFYANNRPSNQSIPVSIPVQAGQTIGILGGCGTSVIYSSFAAPGTYQSNVFGVPMTISRFGTQSNLHTTGGNQPVWSEPAGQIGRVLVTIAQTPGYAYAIPFGTGCYDASRTTYEVFANPSTFDLANRSMTAFFTGAGYFVQPGGAYLPPTANATTLQLGDDTETTVALSNPFPHQGGTTSALTVCSNGFVSPGPGNGTGYQPTPAGWLQSPLPRWGQVHDYNPTMPNSGVIRFEEIGGIGYVTWDGVYDHNTTGPGSTFQLQFDTLSGNVTFAFLGVSGIGNGHLVGIAGGGPSRDLGNTDISAALAGSGILVSGIDLFAPALQANARPRLGTTIGIDVTDLPATATFGAMLFGLTDYPTGLPLGALGLPGCSQFVSVDASVWFVPTNGTASLPMTLPTAATFAGVRIGVQAAVLFPNINSAGAMVSNGLRLVLAPN